MIQLQAFKIADFNYVIHSAIINRKLEFLELNLTIMQMNGKKM